MKKLVLSLMMGALALGSMEAQAYSPRSALQGSYNMLVNEVYPSNDYERLCKQRLIQLVPRIIGGANANMTLPVTKGNTALHYAMSLGYQDLIADLLACGADPYYRNHKGKTPIDCIGNDYDGSIRRMVNDYGRPATPSYSGGTTIRQRLSGCLTTVQNMYPANDTMRLYCTRLKTLLPIIINGGDANTTLPITKGNTALHYACGLGYYELVQLLLEAGANPRLRTHKGASPSDCASGANAARIRNLLNRY
jgi:ankyrin repeat protein